MLITTTPIIEGKNIVEYKGLITARNTRAVNIFRDIFTSIRDVFGGRSGSYEKVMAAMTKEMEDELLSQAQQLGANAIIGFRLDYENISSKGKSLIIVYGQGTAVVLR